MLTFEVSKQYKGTGISDGLDRGLLVYQNGALLLDEGMGLGALAVQSDGLNYFASILKVETSPNQIDVILSIDKMLQRTIYGISSKPLTRFIEKTCTVMYKERKKSQRIWFRIGEWINFLLQIKATFEPVPAKGQFVLNYQISHDEILIDVSGQLEEPVDCIFVMNELSGALFHKGIVDGKTSPPPSGWQFAVEGCELYSDESRLSFYTKEHSKPSFLESQLYWGREADQELCWAGFIYQLRTEAKEFQHFKYSVLFHERG